MFFTGSAIRRDAAKLAHWCLASMRWMKSSEDVVLFRSQLMAQGTRESYLDASKIGWFVNDLPKFSFHADFDFANNNERMLSVEAHEDYFGIVLTGPADQDRIWVDMKPLSGTPEGKNAKRLLKEMLAVPGFGSLADLAGRFRS